MMTAVIGGVHVHVVGKDECDVFQNCWASVSTQGHLYVLRGFDNAQIAEYRDGHWSGYAVEPSGMTSEDDDGEDNES